MRGGKGGAGESRVVMQTANHMSRDLFTNCCELEEKCWAPLRRGRERERKAESWSDNGRGYLYRLQLQIFYFYPFVVAPALSFFAKRTKEADQMVGADRGGGRTTLMRA